MNLLTGQAGVWRVASMLALRGYNPHFPGVDHGCDFMIDHGVRIQVKCARRSYTQKTYNVEGAYQFHLRRGAYVRGSDEIVKSAPRTYSNECEFVVLWGIEDDRFWVVPAKEVDGLSLVICGVGAKVREMKFHPDLTLEDILRLRAQGRTRKEIAEHFGMAEAGIKKRLSGANKNGRISHSARVRACEDRWDLIDSYLETFQSTEDFTTSATPSALETIKETVNHV